jgi:hypothetical protein
MKRIIYLILLVLAIGGVVAVGYYFRYRGGSPPGLGGEPGESAYPLTLPPPSREAGAAENPDKFSPVRGAELSRVASGSVLAYFVYSATSSVVLRGDGEVALLNQNGAEVLSGSAVNDILQAGFSYDGKKLAVVFGKRSESQASVFDVQSKSWQPLADPVYAFAWAPRDSRLAYFTKNGTRSEIRIWDTSRAANKPQVLMPLAAEDAVLNWPSPGQILLSQKPGAKIPGTLLKIDLTKRTIVPLMEDLPGLSAVWSGVSDWGVVFVSGNGGRGGLLQLVNGRGEALRTMSFVTIPEKCVFYASREKNEYLVCGVPQNYGTWNALTLPDAYLKKEVFSRDWIYRIDMKTGEIEVIYGGAGEAVDATNLEVADGNLYFRNRLDGSLYGLAL